MWRSGLILGLLIEPQGIGAALFERGGKCIAQAQTKQPLPLARVDHQSLKGALSAGLSKVMEGFPASCRRADNDVRVFLPAAFFAQTALSFDDFPRSPKEAKPLVAWQHCKQLALVEAESCIGFMKEPKRSGKTRVLAQSAPRDGVGALQDALQAHGLIATSIEALEGGLEQNINARHKTGHRLVIWQSESWWSFQLSDESGWPQPAFSAWKTNRYNAAAFIERLERVLKTAGLADAGALELIELHSLGPSENDQIRNWARTRTGKIDAIGYGAWQQVLERVAFT